MLANQNYREVWPAWTARSTTTMEGRDGDEFHGHFTFQLGKCHLERDGGDEFHGHST